MLTPVGQKPGAGQIAQLYEALGGPVEWIGTPYPAIYTEARRRFAGIPDDRILCIGDSPDHDIVGARRAGLPCALVRTGLLADLDDAARLARCRAAGAIADFVIDRFQFEVAPSAGA
jgi:ribonucleotide monophosphatase NagD (HAD superfamily)